jgi:hypothetical protein
MLRVVTPVDAVLAPQWCRFSIFRHAVLSLSSFLQIKSLECSTFVIVHMHELQVCQQ